MAKKKDAKKDKKPSRAETVRAAVDQAFQTTADAGQLTRGRATEIADELVGNIGRLKDALDDARPATAEDVKALRTEIALLGERVGRLETATGAVSAPEPAKRSAATRRGAARPAAGTPSSRASASRAAATKRTSAAAAAAKPGAAKPKPKPKPKPAAPVKTGAASKSRTGPATPAKRPPSKP